MLNFSLVFEQRAHDIRRGKKVLILIADSFSKLTLWLTGLMAGKYIAYDLRKTL